MKNLNTIEKGDYLSIPIEMYKCEAIIRKNKKLSDLEKFTLKLIYNNDSLKDILNAFNVGPHIMNNVLAKLFYRGLIKLKLDKMTVELSNNIMEDIKNNKLDDFVDKAPTYEIKNISLIQEKISGEILSENNLREFLRNPGSLTTNYLDIKASRPGSFPDIQNFSLNKYIKCIRTDIKVEPEDIEKINFNQPLFNIRLYIPLIKENGKKILDLDYELFPRHVQKAWQNAYETQYEIEEKMELDLEVSETQFISSKQFKIHFLQDLILLEDDLKNYYKNKKNLNLRFELEENYNNLEKKFQKFKEKLLSVDKVSIHNNINSYNNFLIENIESVEDFLIVCSPEIDRSTISFFVPIINNITNKGINVLILTGAEDTKISREFLAFYDKFKNEFSSAIHKENRSRVNFFLSNLKINSNFILLGTRSLLINNSSFLNYDYTSNALINPTLKIVGGMIPLNFTEFVLDLLPKNLQFKNFLEKIIIKSNENIIQSISSERMELLAKFEKILNELKIYMQISFIDGIRSAIQKIKAILNDIEQYDIIELVSDYEIEDILIDLMREIRKNYVIITDSIDKNKLGPHFENLVKKITQFSIRVNKKLSQQEEDSWNLGISRLESIKKNNNNINYKIININCLINLIFIQDNLITFSNFKFLSEKKRYNTKNLGLIIHSKRINELYRELSKHTS
ncbi:MAG: hypothetical protein ACFFA0_05880 [Promethearchaeota archaeon]